MAHFTMGTGGH